MPATWRGAEPGPDGPIECIALVEPPTLSAIHLKSLSPASSSVVGIWCEPASMARRGSMILQLAPGGVGGSAPRDASGVWCDERDEA